MGSLLSFIWPPASKFSFDQIPDLSGKVAYGRKLSMIGIGKVTCRVLLEKGAKVYMALRSEQRAHEAITEIRRLAGRDSIVFLKLDLAGLGSVKAGAAEFRSLDWISPLIRAIGVMTPPNEQTTKQGYDLQFGTSVLGHAYLTKLLLPVLLSTLKTSPPKSVRIVNTSSSGHTNAPKGGILWDTLKDGPARIKAGTWVCYFQSKWGNLALSNEHARRYKDDGLVSIAFDPGNIRTDLHRNMGGIGKFLLSVILLYPLEPYGGLTQVYAGTMPAAGELNGMYLIPWARVGKPRPDTLDPVTGTKLWDWIDEQIGEFESSQEA